MFLHHVFLVGLELRRASRNFALVDIRPAGGAEENAVDAEVIADLQNRITETQKDIEVSGRTTHLLT